MGVRAGAGAVVAPAKNGTVQFLAMKKIRAGKIFDVSNIALIHIERAHANFQCLVNLYKNDLCTTYGPKLSQTSNSNHPS